MHHGGAPHRPPDRAPAASAMASSAVPWMATSSSSAMVRDPTPAVSNSSRTASGVTMPGRRRVPAVVHEAVP